MSEQIWWCKKCLGRWIKNVTNEDEKECPQCYRSQMVIESEIWKNLKLKENAKLTAYDKIIFSRLLRNETLENPENIFKIISLLRKFLEGEEISLFINDFRNTITRWKSSKQNFLESIKISEKTGEFPKELSEKYFKAENWCFDLSTQFFIHCSEILEKLDFNFEDDDLAFNNFDNLDSSLGDSVDGKR